MYIVIGAILLMGLLGLALGMVIGGFAKIFRVENDPRIELVLDLLPGANCGGCGKAGCADFAKSVVAGENAPGKCPVSGAEQVAAIAQALGIDPGVTFPQKAVVMCGGDALQTIRRNHYNGVVDCAAAAMVAGGFKGCSYGCLGMGSCAHSCPFGAIEMVNNLAVVHAELCVGCGNCVKSCPRGVIKLVPAAATAFVYCNSPEKGAAKKKLCKVGCIGCRKCSKAFEDKFTVNGFLASVNYECGEFPGENEVAGVGCPAGCLLTEKRHLEIERKEPDWSPEK